MKFLTTSSAIEPCFEEWVAILFVPCAQGKKEEDWANKDANNVSFKNILKKNNCQASLIHLMCSGEKQ